ncbi:hypothetical protein NQ318_009284 [Aromia moschata]|uniref:Uncharacterized protein n=1 Tax=Aromia moschata TaxID=1265417 RepID=A0AAV8YKY0_9CUCU|nr:hypothetical protein NQ318_009284 [Aromia moschata]
MLSRSTSFIHAAYAIICAFKLCFLTVHLGVKGSRTPAEKCRRRAGTLDQSPDIAHSLFSVVTRKRTNNVSTGLFHCRTDTPPIQQFRSTVGLKNNWERSGSEDMDLFVGQQGPLTCRHLTFSFGDFLKEIVYRQPIEHNIYLRLGSFKQWPNTPKQWGLVEFEILGIHIRIFKQNRILPFKPKFRHTLDEGDEAKRLDFCLEMGNRVLNDVGYHKRILFSDESTFSTNGVVSSQHYRYWSETNPHFTISCRRQYFKRLSNENFSNKMGALLIMPLLSVIGLIPNLMNTEYEGMVPFYGRREARI